ncbi:MAG: hypothetical protein WC496_08455 [Phycisphaerae bacterium]
MSKITFWLAAALLVGILTSVRTTHAGVVYSNDFESVVGSEWSNISVDITPAGSRTFLGQFGGNDFVTLSLDNLPAHQSVTLSFDLFVIQSWDGTGADWGPDVWQLSVVDGPELLNTTFSNTAQDGHMQSYPASYSSSQEYPAQTGAAETNTLGYEFYGDSVYNLSFTFTHSANSLTLSFAGLGLQDVCDESWGLDNVTVASSEFAIPEPATVAFFIMAGFFSAGKKKK